MISESEYNTASVLLINILISRAFGYGRVYLPLYKVADTPFYIQAHDLLSSVLAIRREYSY